MARLSYECVNTTRSGLEEDPVSKPFPCAPDKYCFYCCCNPQCCFVIQRKPPKHFWEAWYFWLGIALLLIVLLSTVGMYVVTNCKHNLHQAIAYGRSSRSLSAVSPGREEDGQVDDGHEISINVIPTSAALPVHRKIVLIAPQPSFIHLTPIVA